MGAAFAKAIGNDLPTGIVDADEKIRKELEEGNLFYHVCWDIYSRLSFLHRSKQQRRSTGQPRRDE
jgi:hypothetical protein